MIDAQAMASLGDALEQLKCKLGEGTQALSWRHADRSFEWSLDEAAAVRIWEPLLARLRAPIEQALRDARLKPRDLDSLVLVGGATRMPAVQQMVATLFGRLPYRHLDPDTIVALGAATQAACKARDGAVEELILTDVCPYTLGIATIRGEDIKGAFRRSSNAIPSSRRHGWSAITPPNPDRNRSVLRSIRVNGRGYATTS